jgi:hypothetical protein
MSTLSIPAFHVSDASRAKGNGDVFILSRKDIASSGVFTVFIDVKFDPAVDQYPAGSVSIKADLSDGAKGTFKATSIELINSYGKHNPTVYITGRCADDAQPDAQGCRFWVMVVHNKNPNAQQTPDVVGFAIHDRNGNRIAYGTGPLRTGDFDVAPE